MFLRNLKANYKQTALGPLWIVLQPLLQVIIFTIIFNKVAKLDAGDVPYPLFNFLALIIWTFFMQCVMRVGNSLRESRDLLTRVYFPRLIMPLVGVMASMLDFLVAFFLGVGFAIYLGFSPGVGLLWVPLFVFLSAMIGVSVGIWTAPWIVQFWDVNTIMNYALRAWMFASPVVYTLREVPERWMMWYKLNPMAHIVEQFRNSLLGKTVVFEALFFISLLPFLLLLIGGLYYFRRAERNIVDIA